VRVDVVGCVGVGSGFACAGVGHGCMCMSLHLCQGRRVMFHTRAEAGVCAVMSTEHSEEYCLCRWGSLQCNCVWVCVWGGTLPACVAVNMRWECEAVSMLCAVVHACVCSG
jgi:hypothetical protein